MLATQENRTGLSCPHCESTLLPFRLPEGGGWEDPHHWACFNDDCPYYRSGWDWMRERYEIGASYRYRVTDAATGHATPIAVWSPTALRDHIIDEIIDNPTTPPEDDEADRDGQQGADENHE